MDATGTMYVLLFLIVLCLLLFCACLALFFRLRRAFRALDARQDALAKELRGLDPAFSPNPFSSEPEAHYRETSWSGGGRADVRELKSRLRTAIADDPEISAKYRYVAELERSGMGPRELAEILEVSEEEAAQMMSLSRVRRSGGSSPAPPVFLDAHRKPESPRDDSA